MPDYAENFKLSIIQKVLSQPGRSVSSIATASNIPKSTLRGWLAAYKTKNMLKLSTSIVVSTGNGKWPLSKRLTILLDCASLDDAGIGAYCRKHGIYQSQLAEWKKSLMNNEIDKLLQQHSEELKRISSENKALRHELKYKDKALAEASALLILQKKASLIWGVDGDN